MKILNLFAGIGGNRTEWKGKITAVEFDEKTAKIYKKRFPDDEIIIADAYEFLVEHIDDGWDFIWASPPCQTHSRLNLYGQGLRLPDLRLYSIILFLKRFASCDWVVENVIPYYVPLIRPTVKLGRHLFWSNFFIPEREFKQPKGTLKDLDMDVLKSWHNIDIDINRQQIRNCVDFKISKYIFKNIKKQKVLL